MTLKADLILHPVRLRVIQALVGKTLTPQQIKSIIPDVPHATLYRHINRLVDAGVLVVAEERPVRGVVERAYSLPDQAAELTEQDVAEVAADDHMRYFMTFVASLVGDFGRYLGQGEFDLAADGVGYRQAPLYLSDEELQELVAALQAVLTPYRQNTPRSDRRRRNLSTIIIREIHAEADIEQEQTNDRS